MSKLSIKEWPDEVVPYMADSTFSMAFLIREITNCVMIPSPDPEAHVRATNGTSLHCIGKDLSGLSHATDWFGRNEQAPTLWLRAQMLPGLGGFGIYFDAKLHGKKTILFHGDTRPTRELWVCPDTDERKYILFRKEPTRYLKVLGDQFALMRKW